MIRVTHILSHKSNYRSQTIEEKLAKDAKGLISKRYSTILKKRNNIYSMMLETGRSGGNWLKDDRVFRLICVDFQINLKRPFHFELHSFRFSVIWTIFRCIWTFQFDSSKVDHFKKLTSLHFCPKFKFYNMKDDEQEFLVLQNEVQKFFDHERRISAGNITFIWPEPTKYWQMGTGNLLLRRWKMALEPVQAFPQPLKCPN